VAHLQQQILDTVTAILVAASTDAGANVFLDHLDPLELNELPAILVEESPVGESVAAETVGGLLERRYAVRITGVVAHATQYGAKAREMGLQIEKALDAAGAQIFALAKGGYALESSRLLLSGESKDAKAAREQNWHFTYYAFPGAPDQPA
jgi:hypothetical protein